MKKIGLIGLGTMGFAIGSNLLKAGYELYVTYHNNRKPAEALEQEGAVICEHSSEIARNASVIFLVVPTEKEVAEQIFSENGILKGARAGLDIIDMSTIDLFASRDFAERLLPYGVRYIDAPISGGPAGAKNATMAIMIGADENDCLDLDPIFRTIGKRIVYCGAQGLGMAAKLANNLIASATMAAISEAFALSVKAGSDPEKLYHVLQNATANSTTLNGKVPKYLNNDYSPAFRLKLMCKDLNIVTSTAKKLGTYSPIASLVEQLYVMCKEPYGELDSGAISLFYQKQANVSFQRREMEKDKEAAQ